jgi:hypothetical protein
MTPGLNDSPTFIAALADLVVSAVRENAASRSLPRVCEVGKVLDLNPSWAAAGD